mmetsp:Transcript_29100/g.93809  ORF Transcript_29100/g.93809 Transcript_29100/m.93809 type:complete len:249 (-) Transcript_29100:363-1109(-)
MGRRRQVRRPALGAVRRLPRSRRHLLAGRVQRLPADGSARLGARHPAGAERRRAAALRPQRLGQVRVAMGVGSSPAVARHSPPRDGGLVARRVGGPRRRPCALPAARLAPGSARRTAGPPPVCGRRHRHHRGLPAQPQRLPPRHRGALLARRTAPRHDAAPGALLLAVAVPVDARGVEGQRHRPVAPPVPERRRLLCPVGRTKSGRHGAEREPYAHRRRPSPARSRFAAVRKRQSTGCRSACAHRVRM